MTCLRRSVIVLMLLPCLTSTPTAQDVARLDVLTIAGRPVDGRNGGVIESMPEGETVDFELGCYGVPEDHDVWLLLKSSDGRGYQTFGPARRQRRETGDYCVVTDVAFTTATGQRRMFQVRVGAIRRGQPVPPTVTALDLFSSVSREPVGVAVLRAVPDSGDLRITIVDGMTVEADRVMTVGRSIALAGRTPTTGPVHIVIHPAGTNVYRIVGPADPYTGNWQIQDALLAEPGFPHWRAIELFAITTTDGASLAGRSYELVREKIASRSQTVHLWLQDDVAPPPLEPPAITIARYAIPGGSWVRVDQSLSTHRVSASELILDGEVLRLRQGQRLAAVVGEGDEPLWTVLPGAPVMAGTTWVFPRLPLPANAGARRRLRVYIIAAEDGLPEGAVDYQTWQSRTVAISAPLNIDARGRPGPAAAEWEIAIAGISADQVLVAGPEVPCFVYVGHLQSSHTTWNFVRAIRTTGGRYAAIGAVPKPEGRGPGESNTRLIAIATRAPLPSLTLTAEEWAPHTEVISDIVALPASEPAPKEGRATSLAGFPPLPGWMTVALLLLLLLTALRFVDQRSGAITPVLLQVAEVCRSVRTYWFGHIVEVPTPRAVPSAISLVLLAIGVTMTLGYFPLYRDIVRESLHLSRPTAESMARLLVLSLVMMGLVLDVTAGHGQGEEDRTARGSASRVFMLFLLVLMAGALLCFQFLLYYSYYAIHSSEGSIMPPAWGAIAVFISLMEMINAFWVARHGTALFTWIGMHAVMAPFWLGERTCRLLIRPFASIS